MHSNLRLYEPPPEESSLQLTDDQMRELFRTMRTFEATWKGFNEMLNDKQLDRPKGFPPVFSDIHQLAAWVSSVPIGAVENEAAKWIRNPVELHTEYTFMHASLAKASGETGTTIRQVIDPPRSAPKHRDYLDDTGTDGSFE